MLNQQHPILNCIDSYIEPLIKRVLQTDNLGACCGGIELDTITSSCGRTKGDRFKLSIPYAKQNLIWNVLFDSQCPEMGPDFIFNDDSFLADLDIDTLSTQVPSLVQWDPNDADALLNVLRELLFCYKEHQIQLFKKQNRLQMEYDTLVGTTGIKKEDIEIVLLPLGSKPTEAIFLITLLIDLSQLQIRSTESVTDSAKLLITFYGSEWNHVVPQLYLSKSLEKTFGGATLNLPPFSPDKYLMDYVPEINKCIEEKINTIVRSIENRQNFITCALFWHRFKVIEYDTIQFTYATFLMEEKEFEFILSIVLSPQFPVERPIVKLLSIYHFKSKGDLYSDILQDFPYNPKWPPKKMVISLTEHLINAANIFRENSSKNPY